MSHSTPHIAKTNAARLLDTLHIPYRMASAPVDASDLSAVTMAARLGVDPATVFKTLVARGDRTGVIMACIPAAAELDLKALAVASGNKLVAAARPWLPARTTRFLWTKAPSSVKKSTSAQASAASSSAWRPMTC